jgi:hypothetical protein
VVLFAADALFFDVPRVKSHYFFTPSLMRVIASSYMTSEL